MKPCTCNGRRLLVRDEGLLCEACGRAYRRTISPAVKRLVEAVEKACSELGFEGTDGETRIAKAWFPALEALATVREEIGEEEVPTVTCENCGELFPENQLPDADMKGEVVCRKCIEKMALGN